MYILLGLLVKVLLRIRIIAKYNQTKTIHFIYL